MVKVTKQGLSLEANSYPLLAVNYSRKITTIH